MKEALLKGKKSDEWYTPIETVQTILNVFPPKAGDKIIARCIETGRPCVLVLPIDALGGYKGINYLVRQI